MILHRLVKKEYIKTALDGVGAKKFGGRWNSKGVKLVYAAESLSLCVLEFLVNCPRPASVKNLFHVYFEVDDSHLIELDFKKLPKSWARYPASDETKAIGDEWVNSERSMGLIVPSVVIPSEKNIVINPDHENFSQIGSSTVEKFDLDERLIP